MLIRKVLSFFVFFTLCLPQGIIEKQEKEYSFDLSGTSIAVVIAEGVEFNEATIVPGLWEKWGAKIYYVGTSDSVKSHEIFLNELGFSTRDFTIKADIRLDSFNHNGIDLIYFPGGWSPASLLKHNRRKVFEIINHFNDKKKYIAGICHGPEVILESGIAKGKKISGEFSSEEISKWGAVPVFEKFIADGNIFTGKYPYLETFAAGVAENILNVIDEKETLPDFAFGMTEHFHNKDVKDSIIEKIVEQASFTEYDFNINVIKPWKVVAVSSANLRAKTKTILKNKMTSFYAGEGPAKGKYIKFINNHIDVPVYLLVFSKKSTLDKYLPANYEAQYVKNVQSVFAGAFINNLRTTAEKFGLGTHQFLRMPVSIAEKELKKLFDVGDEYFLASIVALGYPSQKNCGQIERPVSEILSIY